MLRNSILFFSICCLACQPVVSQQKIENIIIITTDGLRWQEVFKGMDTTIANLKQYNEGDSAYIFKKYGAADATESRKKIFPFLWGTIAQKGQLYGNRTYNNKVDNANQYWFSYPGYNEIFTGNPDPKINSNNYPPNPNTTVLEFLNKQPFYKGKVAAFGAWEAFNRILNEQRSGFPVIAAFDNTGGASPSMQEKLINKMRSDSYKPWDEGECLDVFTHYAAMEYLTAKKPRVLYVAYGETDEWAHAGKYKSYLDAAHQFDQWLQAIWSYLQQDAQYKDKTALFVTVDHGRGDADKKQWTSHGESIPDAHEIWFGVMGPGITQKGEIKTAGQIYQKQFAQTIATLVGLTFTADHPIAEGVSELGK
ncbi:MAG: alkaline phosphatase family protein [Chitinophagaceae bacterium]